MSVLLVGCVSVDHRPSSVLSVGGFHKETAQHTDSSKAHSSQGMSVNFEHKDGEGLLYVMHLATHHSRTIDRNSDLDSTAAFMPEPVGEEPVPRSVPLPDSEIESRYWLSSLGIGFGYYSQYVGGFFGFHFIQGPQGAFDIDSSIEQTPFPIPWLELRAGNLGSGWATLRVGPKLGLSDGLMGFFGGEFVGEHLSGSLGIGVIGNFFFTTGRSEVSVDGGEIAGCASLEWLSKRGWGAGLRATVGDSYSVEATLVLDFNLLHAETQD